MSLGKKLACVAAVMSLVFFQVFTDAAAGVGYPYCGGEAYFGVPTGEDELIIRFPADCQTGSPRDNVVVDVFVQNTSFEVSIQTPEGVSHTGRSVGNLFGGQFYRHTFSKGYFGWGSGEAVLRVSGVNTASTVKVNIFQNDCMTTWSGCGNFSR